MAGPYVMNSYGMIRGLCARAGDENAGDSRRRAENLALYYLRCQDRTTGKFECCWGETPFSGNGLIQQASAVAALWDLHRIWPQAELAGAARQCWQNCLTSPSMRFHWTVHNQALRACEALILGIRARGDSRPDPAEKALLQMVGRRVSEAQWGNETPVAGAISQSLSHDDFIMPYQGKCLNPLVMLAELLEAPVYLEVAQRLADFILQNLTAGGEGPLLSGQYVAQGPGLRRGRRLYRARHLWSGLEPVLRRYRRQQITHWQFGTRPRWIARGLDTARGLDHLGKALGEERYREAAEAMVQEALHYQTPLGGLRNTLGFFGEDPQEGEGRVWQDAAAIPRWNSYAVQFLHELASGTPVIPPILPGQNEWDEVPLKNNLTLRETGEELSLTDREAKVVWTLRKGQRWGRPFRPVSRWDEGAVATGRRSGEKA